MTIVKKLTGIALLFLVPAFGNAGEIYQCTAADGSKSFQATPCPSDTKEDLRELKTASASRSAALRPRGDANNFRAPAASCRDRVIDEYDSVPDEIEAYYEQRREQCREYFQSGTPEMSNCYQLQDEIRAKKYEDLEEHKANSLERCDD